MALNYLKSGWSKWSSSVMGNQQSQESGKDEEQRASHEDSTPFNPDDISSSSESEHERSPPATMRATTPISSLAPRTLSSSSKQKSQNKPKTRKRQPSFDTSSMQLSSDGGDLDSIPYRADEAGDRDEFVKNNRDTREDSATCAPQVQLTKSQTPEHDAHALTESASHRRQSSRLDADKNGAEPSQTSKVGNQNDQRYPCPQADRFGCSQTFSTPKTAKRHADSVHLKKTFSCTICSRDFARADKLKSHMTSHSRDKRLATVVNTVVDTDAAPHNRDKDIPTPRTEHSEEGYVKTNSEQNLVQSHFGFQAVNAKPVTKRVNDLNTTPNPQNHVTESRAVTGSDGDMDETPVVIPQRNLSPAALIDQEVEASLIKETPRLRSAKKRKRDASSSSHKTAARTDTTKRQRRNTLSPPGSSSSGQLRKTKDESQSSARQKVQSPTRASMFKNSQHGSLDSFAKPWAPGSQLYHPIHNPRSPKKRLNQQEVEFVQSTEGDSSSKAEGRGKQAKRKNNSSRTDTDQLARDKRQRAIYTSPKGKRKAELNVEYSSPPPDKGTEVVDDEEDEDYDPRQQRGQRLATSVARKTQMKHESKLASHRKERSQDTGDDADDTDSSARSEDNASDSQEEVYACKECGGKYKSRKALRKHEIRPDNHKTLHKCKDCNVGFIGRAKLQEHEKVTGHGSGTGYHGSTGPFSSEEVDKILRWRNLFCQEYDISHETFNDMMTDTLRRSKGFTWPYQFIAKPDFLQEYYGTLPHRDRRSMHRYRERAFQNVTRSEWTRQDDEELSGLVGEIGSKWVEIGQRLNRTQDAVFQRWKNKLQYNGKALDGEWSSVETERLVSAVNQVKKESGHSLDPDAEVRIPWEAIAKMLEGKRTAQQCSNKWRALNFVRVRGKFVKPDGSTRSSMSSTPISRPIETPSRMTKRLSGQTPHTLSSGPRSKRTLKSEQYVYNSDDSDNNKSSAETGSDIKEHNDDEAKIGNGTDASQNNNSAAVNAIGGEKIATETVKPNFEASESSEVTREQPQSSEDDRSDDDGANNSYHLPKNPFGARTPRNNGASLSQSFNQTQANTSALRVPAERRLLATQDGRPSPNIAIQMRPRLSSMEMLDLPDADVSNDRPSDSEESNSDGGTGSASNKELESAQLLAHAKARKDISPSLTSSNDEGNGSSIRDDEGDHAPTQRRTRAGSIELGAAPLNTQTSSDSDSTSTSGMESTSDSDTESQANAGLTSAKSHVKPDKHDRVEERDDSGSDSDSRSESTSTSESQDEHKNTLARDSPTTIQGKKKPTFLESIRSASYRRQASSHDESQIPTVPSIASSGISNNRFNIPESSNTRQISSSNPNTYQPIKRAKAKSTPKRRKIDWHKAVRGEKQDTSSSESSSNDDND